MPYLTHATRDFRFQKMYRWMDDAKVDAIVFSSGESFQFATNFHTDVQVWERPIYALIPRSGKPYLLMNELSTNHVRFSLEKDKLWADDIEFYTEHPRITDRLALPHQLPHLLKNRLKSMGLTTSSIAFESEGHVAVELRKMLPGATIRNYGTELRSLRWQKCDEELNVMREASALSDWLQDRYRENIRPGRLIQELDWSMAALCAIEAANRFPGENFELRTRSQCGPSSASPHGDGASCGQVIRTGDVLVNIIIPRLNGLAIENERTWFCGQPSKEQVRYWTAAHDANAAGSAACVVDSPVCAIDAAAQAVIDSRGMGKHIIHRTGHGMGIVNHEFPEDMPFCTRPLMKGEVYSVEPGIYVPGLGGFRLDDTVVVGETPEILTATPRSLEYATIV